ncbi:DUF1510 family protein [Domibacillus epiphyticus]|uniref:DUF1510 domain-containing protein n=1 Tax=Domibacillus epiphyticus TaxID=1714355 RepID=A0A1V2A9G0_9BACI|nr:DUF1510 family protein [Domibacillus epiphyticus]OMP67606.1 hypothetical protein BTO28_06580 [Domibacillus epiphyticus]
MEHTSRAERKTKRRKTNRILNTAIAVVVLLIIIVGFTIFAGGNDEEAIAPEESKPAQEQEATVTEEESEEDLTETEKPVEEEENSDEEVVITEGTDPNVEQDIVDPNWKGVGTSQTGDHTSSFETDSTDWQEKVNALSYATGIPEDNMTVWFISGNGPQGAIGTVSPKTDQNDAYRVYIEWVDGEGWKPVKVQKLEQNDKGR